MLEEGVIKYISYQMVFAYMAVWSVSKSRKVGIVDYGMQTKAKSTRLSR